MSAWFDDDVAAGLDALLVANATIVPSLERRLLTMSWPAALDAPARLVKTDWLLADLGSLPEPIEFELEVTDLAAGWGLFYVLEGSTLGGSAILARLGARGADSRFLRGYGRSTGVRWRRFLDLLGIHLRDPGAVSRAADAAARVFDCYLGELSR